MEAMKYENELLDLVLSESECVCVWGGGLI